MAVLPLICRNQSFQVLDLAGLDPADPGLDTLPALPPVQHRAAAATGTETKL